MSPPSPRDLESYIQHTAEEEKANACFQIMSVQAWHGDDCTMEDKVVKCGMPVQTNGCPLAGAERLVLNKVESLSQPAPPRGHSQRLSTPLIVVVTVVVLLALVVVGLSGWDYTRRRKRASWGGGDRNDRVEYRPGTTPDMANPQPNLEHQRRQDGNVAYFPSGVPIPRRSEAAARVPQSQACDRVSEETGRTLVASDRQVRSVASGTTLRGASNVDDEEEAMSNLEGMLTFEGTSSSGSSLIFASSQAPSLDGVAEYRSWMSAA